MGDMFSDKRLKALSRTMRIMFPARSRGEHAIRQRDKASVVNEDTVVIEKSSPSVIDGALNRNKLLTGTAVFYCVDYVDARDVRRIAEPVRCGPVRAFFKDRLELAVGQPDVLAT